MKITFRFDSERAIAAMAYFLQRLGPCDKAKLMKLMYLAEREFFLRHGRPLTGDRLCAMRWGPVPSSTLDLVNGDPMSANVFDYLHVEDRQVALRQTPLFDLPDEIKSVLDDILRLHGSKKTWDLVRETHSLPEYVESYVEGTSRPISYEQIARLSGDSARFASNRVVLPVEALEWMPCTIGPGSDL